MQSCFLPVVLSEYVISSFNNRLTLKSYYFLSRVMVQRPLSVSNIVTDLSSRNAVSAASSSVRKFY